MFYDLNVAWNPEDRDLPRTLAFLHELGYNVIALSHPLSGKLPTDLTCSIPTPLPFAHPPTLRILRRCTLTLSDTSSNHRLSTLTSSYNLLALRPTDEKTLKSACESLECDLISLDLTQRYQFFFKFKTLAQAIERGVRFEVCYSPGITASASEARRNLISNVVQLIRATRGKGIILSSGAKSALGVRSPWDVINLTHIWGLGQERGKEAVTREARSVVATAALKRSSYRGVVDIVYGGEKPEVKKVAAKVEQKNGKQQEQKGQKRKAETAAQDSKTSDAGHISNREKRRRAAEEKAKAANMTTTITDQPAPATNDDG